jgi:site-specific recombinase XerD
MVSSIDSLSEFQETGRVMMGKKRKPLIKLDGTIGATMESYIAYKRSVYQIRDITCNNNRFYLYNFLIFLNGKDYDTVNQITSAGILLFVVNLRFKNPATKHAVLIIIKGYLRYLYHHQLISTDFSIVIPKDNYKSQAQLPSTFSREEIKLLLESIDRGNPRGRRDYAVLLLAAKLGLRASDLAGLKFEHILWEQHLISFEQIKTKRSINVPLLPEIGNAIIDYLKNGRPISADSHCFLQLISPYKPIDKGSIGNIVSYHLRIAGINCKGRKHGSHALRHSLAGALLDDKMPIPVISEVLGHGSSETTMCYLRIDMPSLRQCALNVPEITTSFYNREERINHV